METTMQRNSHEGVTTGGAKEMIMHRKSASNTSSVKPAARTSATTIISDCK